MRTFLSCLALLIPLSVVAAPPVDATRVANDAERLTADRQSDGAIRTTEDWQRRSRILEQSAQIELDIESGRARIPHAEQQRLNAAVDAVLSIPVDVAVVPNRSPLANGTISGTVRDAATGLPVAIANAVRVQAFDFTSQIAPTGAGIVNNVNINASGQYTLTLPPGKYHIRTVFNNQGFIQQAFGFGNCVDNFYCPRYVGTIVTVPDGAAGPTVDFSMPQGARISGVVTRSDTMAAVSGVSVIARGENDQITVSGNTNALGEYTLIGLAPGRYRVFANPPGPLAGFLGEFHDGTPCGDADCFTRNDVTYLNVSGTGTTSGINIAIDPTAGSISGTITDADTGLPIVDDGSQTFRVILRSEDLKSFMPVTLDPTGSFNFARLRPGNYILSAEAPNYQGKIVTGVAPVTTRNCVGTCDPFRTGGRIGLAASANLTGLNFTLDRGATISGHVRSAAGAVPIVGANVTLQGSTGLFFGTTDASGNFEIRGLPGGTYYANAEAVTQNFVTTWLGDVVCRGFFCSRLGLPVTVATNGTLPGLVFNLAQGGTVSGQILDATTSAPTPSSRTRIELFLPTGETVAQVFQPQTGTYSVPGLTPGAYKAVFVSTSVVGWIDTAFGGLPCARGGCDLSLLPTVFVTAGATTSGINGTLARGPVVTGQITDADTGQPVRRPAWEGGTYPFSAMVALNNNLSNYAGFATVDGAGQYLSRTGFPPGTFFLSTFLLRNNFSIGGGYIDELYDNVSCPYGSCGLTTGTAINFAGGSVSGINMALSRGGGIEGRITNAAGGAGLAGVTLRAYNTAGNLVAVSGSNPDGDYRLDGLPSGDYFVTTDNVLGFQDEVWDNLSCEPFCNPVSGTAITVSGTATTAGRNFALDQSVSVSGAVMDGGSAANVTVEIYGQIGNLLGTTVTNAGGNYAFTNLAPGRFFVRTRNATGRTDDLYWDIANPENTSPTKPDCVGLACQVRRGSPINLSAGGSFPAANLVLTAPGRIEGQITNLATTNPLSGITVQLLDTRGAVVGTQVSNASGFYAFSALAAGNYHLVSRGTPGFIDLAFPTQPCPQSCNGLNGLAIPVTAGGNTSGIDLALGTGASISGTVRNSATALPIPGATVQVYDANAIPVAQIATNPSGNYELANVPNGNFFVRTQNMLGFVNEVFNNRSCGGYCDILNGDAVTISGGVPVGLVDFSLDAGGSISGRISNAGTGSGIGLAEVQAIDVNGLIASRATTNAAGDYTIGGLQPGNYRVRTVNSAGFINQIYRTPTPLTCSPTPCLLSAATPVAVAGPVTGINMGLGAGGTISGTAADLFNNPLPSGTAILLDANGIELFSNPVVNGLFEFNGLANGSYYVLIRNTSGLVDLLFPNVPCPAGACNITALGTPVVLPGTRSTAQVRNAANVDLRLPQGRAIAGKVTAGAQPLSGVTVSIYNAAGQVVASGVTDPLGDYVTGAGLPAGPSNSYFAATTTPAARGVGNGLINEAWNNVACMQDCNVAAVATAIPLTAAIVPLGNIDFSLAAGGRVSGRVSDAGNGPLSLVDVRLFDASGRLVGTARTNSLGDYVVDGIAPGNYFAHTANVLGLFDVVFGGGQCAGACNPANGTPITVTGTNTTPNINFTLVANLPNALFANGFED